MEQSIKKKTILITGGTRGIGKAIALSLAKGNNIVLSYLTNDKNANSTLRECSLLSKNVLLFKGDISKKQVVEELIQTITNKFNSLDIIINNAAVNRDKNVHSLTEEDWDIVINTNLKGAFLVSQIGSKYMIANDISGQIIFLGSTTGIQGRKNGINYCVSKAGIIVMTKCLALELAPKIKVNCIIPGLTWTDETEARFSLSLNHEKEIQKRKIPLNRIGRPEDIAEVVEFLIRSSYINGQKIIVDGGEFMF